MFLIAVGLNLKSNFGRTGICMMPVIPVQEHAAPSWAGACFPASSSPHLLSRPRQSVRAVALPGVALLPAEPLGCEFLCARCPLWCQLSSQSCCLPAQAAAVAAIRHLSLGPEFCEGVGRGDSQASFLLFTMFWEQTWKSRAKPAVPTLLLGSWLIRLPGLFLDERCCGHRRLSHAELTACGHERLHVVSLPPAGTVSPLPGLQLSRAMASPRSEPHARGHGVSLPGLNTVVLGACSCRPSVSAGARGRPRLECLLPQCDASTICVRVLPSKSGVRGQCAVWSLDYNLLAPYSEFI